MSGRVDPDAAAAAQGNAPQPPPPWMATPALVPVTSDPDDRWGGHALPNDHPAWMKDTLSLSQRARALIATLRPVILNVVAAWEHRARSILVGGRRLSVDPSGSYRLD